MERKHKIKVVDDNNPNGTDGYDDGAEATSCCSNISLVKEEATSEPPASNESGGGSDYEALSDSTSTPYSCGSSSFGPPSVSEDVKIETFDNEDAFIGTSSVTNDSDSSEIKSGESKSKQCLTNHFLKL